MTGKVKINCELCGRKGQYEEKPFEYISSDYQQEKIPPFVRISGFFRGEMKVTFLCRTCVTDVIKGLLEEQKQFEKLYSKKENKNVKK